MFLMRVSLPDRPGSLGAVASALGTVGADINAVEIVEKNNDFVVDDFIVDLPDGQLPEILVSACEVIEGVRVDWISRYPEGGGLQSDLEALERMTADPARAAETLAQTCPVVFRSHWAALLEEVGGRHRMVFGTPLAPDFSDGVPTALTAGQDARRVELTEGWLPGWGETTAVIVELSNQRLIVVGRHGGPPFLDSELARLNHLAGLVS